MEDLTFRKTALKNSINSFKKQIEPLEKELAELEQLEEKTNKKKTIKESV